MQKPIDGAVEPTQDEFVVELREKKFNAGQLLAAKKSELAQIEASQRKLNALLEAEKHQTSGSKKHKKGKAHDANKTVRLDIVKNERKFKEQEGKIAQMRKEVGHLESDLKELTHDLAVVEQSH